MNYQAIINNLHSWEDDELLFRDYSLVRKGALQYDEFIAKHRSDPVNLGFALHPESMSTHRVEDEFIKTGRNVSMIKHPRYLPLFFHAHEFFEMIYVLSGQCVQHLWGQQFSLSAGDCYLLAPNTVHGIEVYDDSIVLNILIRYSTFLDIFVNTVRDKSLVSRFFLDNIYSKKRLTYLLFHTHDDLMVHNHILDMYSEQMHFDEYSDRMICSLLTILFAHLMRLHANNLEIPTTHNRKDAIEGEFLSYIIGHMSDLSINQVADHFHFSRQYCSKMVKAITGYTFSELLTNVRIQRGMNLLLSTALSIADISENVGYKNPETFIRVFKKRMNVTPSQYRRENAIGLSF